MQRQKMVGIVVALALLMSSTLAIAAANHYQAKAQERAVLAAVAAQALGGNHNINWSVSAGGGNTMSSASFTLKSSVGQPVVGSFSSASYTVHNGFWQGIFNKIATYAPLILEQAAGGS